MDNLFSSSDSRKRYKRDVSDKEDVISKLPDSLLHRILSFLSTRDAIQTSLLAKRWKFLWTYLSDFDIEDNHSQNMNYLFNQVDTILQKAKFIKRFRFVAYGAHVDVGQAHSWIFALLKHKIQELELSFDLRSSFLLINNLSVLKTLNMMNLEIGCVLKVPSRVHFPCLKTLTLQRITFVDKTSAQNLFSGCPVLQKLTLFSCGWKNVKNVSIQIPTVTTLIIEDGFFRDTVIDCQVTIDAANLRSFFCTNDLIIEFIPTNLTSLAYACIDVTSGGPSVEQFTISRLLKILSRISHVKSLRISKYTLETLCRAENLLSHLPTFHNLTKIGVSHEMNSYYGEELMAILEKSPKLEVLHIVDGFDPDCYSDGDAWTLDLVPHCLKYSLKLVSISHFCGRVAEIQLLSFLVRNATTLKIINLFCGESLSADLKKQEDISNQLQVMRKDLPSYTLEFWQS